jgi:hypothetical protein
MKNHRTGRRHSQEGFVLTTETRPRLHYVPEVRGRAIAMVSLTPVILCGMLTMDDGG